ncbi:hypothetical protein V492_05489 [Pseudogymnoascus sp. VKM F-4246]|nr:hypothetical protein V492_05489 [Pseudogymnoascus sp. VKM F-4246]
MSCPTLISVGKEQVEARYCKYAVVEIAVGTRWCIPDGHLRSGAVHLQVTQRILSRPPIPCLPAAPLTCLASPDADAPTAAYARFGRGRSDAHAADSRVERSLQRR